MEPAHQIDQLGKPIGDVVEVARVDPDVITSAIGGMMITQTVEGLERYPVNLRYPRELGQPLLSDAAAAVFVITSEDIRRSGVTSIPEALRMAPGIQVGRIDASKWAITARGFNGRFANKLLVLMDGRTVYSPTFGGTFWDMQNTLLEDIDRIEVIRGPGGSLWGANAVNGVINIITKKASQTHGVLFSVEGGDEQVSVSARYGGKLGESAFYRVYARASRRDRLDNRHRPPRPGNARRTPGIPRRGPRRYDQACRERVLSRRGSPRRYAGS